MDDQMEVKYRKKICSLKYAIDNCEPGESIEGIHVNQYDKLLKRFEEERGRKFVYSVDMRYGDWRFILFDPYPTTKPKPVFIHELIKPKPIVSPKVIPL